MPTQISDTGQKPTPKQNQDTYDTETSQNLLQQSRLLPRSTNENLQ